MIMVDFLFIFGSYGKGLAIMTMIRFKKLVILSLHIAQRLNAPMAMEAERMEVSTRDCPVCPRFISFPFFLHFLEEH